METAALPRDYREWRGVYRLFSHSLDILRRQLHNMCAMLEGFWPLEAGPGYRASLVLGVQVRDAQNQVVETQEISPCKLDLPIGYWKWALGREFR